MLFSPMGQYDAEAVLLVSLAETPITLTAHQVTSMPWKQFVRLMKVRPPVSHSAHSPLSQRLSSLGAIKNSVLLLILSMKQACCWRGCSVLRLCIEQIACCTWVIVWARPAFWLILCCIHSYAYTHTILEQPGGG